MASSPDQSTSSSTCWTSGLAMVENLLQNAGFLTRPMPTPVTNTSLHLVQKRSGLFDNELAGTTDFAGLDTDLTEDFHTDEWDKLGGEVMHLLDGIVPECEMTEDDYLDSFVDLSSFLLPPEQELKKPQEDEPCTTVDISDLLSQTRPQKRKAEDTVQPEQCVAGFDHDYVSKKVRLSSSASEIPDSDMDVEADVETFEVASTSTSKPCKAGSAVKYRERRMKNNIASKRSREIRKKKYIHMEAEAEYLVSENEKLRNKITELEKLAKEMKASLIHKLAGKN